MDRNRRIIMALVFICLLFSSLIGYLTYFEVFLKDEVVSNSYNQRLYEYEQDIQRGSIFDRNGTVLAYSEEQDGVQKRIYPYDNMYSHVIGRSSNTYGKSLIEQRYNDELLGINELKVVVDLKNEITGQKARGNDIYLTIDHQLQSLADQLLEGKKGAVVAMDPNTGEILCMVSKPDYNPNEGVLDKNWEDLIDSENSPILTRSVQGLYPPGSVFKIIVTTKAIESGMMNDEFIDNGSIEIDGKIFTNYGGKSYGVVGLREALTNSINTVYAQIGVSLGNDKLRELSEDFWFNKSINFELSVKKSNFPYDMDETEMAAVGIGQGELLVTPLHMAMITSCIANDGVMVNPVLIKKITGFTGAELDEPKVLCKAISPEIADDVNQLMQDVVNNGTGSKAAVQGVQVAGKTGTAQNEGEDHAWFVGFAPADDPQIAVAVVIENSGSTGGEAAAPIAGEIFEQWLKNSE